MELSHEYTGIMLDPVTAAAVVIDVINVSSF